MLQTIEVVDTITEADFKANYYNLLSHNYKKPRQKLACLYQMELGLF